jgi:parallel beta-helix repeat protein
MKILQIFVICLVVGLFFSGTAFAATNVSACQNITSSGMYDLNTSLSGTPNPIDAFTGSACIRINASDVVLDCQGFSITNNGTTSNSSFLTNGIHVDGNYNNVTIQNCPNVSGYTYGVGLDSADNSVIRNVTAFENEDAGIFIARSGNNNLVQNCTSHSHSGTYFAWSGFYMHSGSNNRFIDNIAYNNTRGFEIRSGSDSTNMSDNTAYDNTYGFYIEESDNNRFKNNNVSTSNTGIYLTGSNAVNNVIYNNTLGGGSLYGIRLSSTGGDNNITENLVTGYTQYGIYLSSSDNNTLSGNNVSSNSQTGFYLTSSDNNTVADNIAYDNNYYGIRLSSSSNNSLMRNNATLNGYCPTTYHLSQLSSSGQWNELYSEPFAVTYSTKEFLFSKTGDSITVRIVQNGPVPFGDVEAVQLSACGQDIIPTYAKYVDSGESVLEDILEIDNNVIVAHDKEIELSWDIPASCNTPATLYLTANEYFAGLPLYFPDAGYATVSENTAVPIIDGMLDETDDIENPTYTVLWTPDSGHPEAYTYIYTSQDEENVYISLDITSDNTNEYGLDWAEVTFVTSSGTRAFRIDDYNNEYGKCGFGLTSKVAYKHQTCEFSIPKSEIGEELNFRLHYYGTEAIYPSAIYLLDGGNNVLTSNNMSQTLCGNGGRIYASTNNTLTNNIENGNEQYGLFLYNSNNTLITGDRFFNNTESDLYVQFTSASYILNLSQVIFDSALGNLVNYTKLSLNDDVNASATYSISWAALPASPPKSSVAQKSVNITEVAGTAILDSITWHWNTAETSGYNEASFGIWEYNSSNNWTNMGATLSAAANTLNILNLDPGSIYAILADTVSVPAPSSGGSKSKKSLSAVSGQICPGDSIQVNVTSSDSALANAEVRLIYLPTFDVTDKLTNSSGSAMFSAAKSGDYKLVVDKSGYEKVISEFTISTCPSEEEPPVEPPPVEPPPVITPPTNITIPPFIDAIDQDLDDSIVDILLAYLDQPGCVVLHVLNSDGTVGEVVGTSEVFSGNKSNLGISLTNYNNETNLMAMLHYDDGDGVCEPEEDKPATVDGTPLTVNFKLTLPPAAPPVEPPEPTPPVAPTKPTPPPPADDLMGIFLMLLLVLILLGVIAAAYYFLGKGGKKKYGK